MLKPRNTTKEEKYNQEKANKEKAKQEKANQKKAKEEKIKEEKANQERIKQEKAKEEKEIQERIKQEKDNKEKAKQEKARLDKADKKQAKLEKALLDQAIKEKAKQEKISQQKAQEEKAMSDKANKEKAKQEKVNQQEKQDKAKPEKSKYKKFKLMRKSSLTERATPFESLKNLSVPDHGLSASLENINLQANAAAKKYDSFFYNLFNDRNVCVHQKKTVTILEPNSTKAVPTKPYRKEKTVDGSKQIVECHLTMSTYLDVSMIGLNQLSRSITKLFNLTQLYIYGNRISKLPKEIGFLIHLKELWMQENIIDSIPIDVGKLHFLEHLDIRHNHISDDSLLVLTQLTKLKILLATHNRLTRLDAIGKLKNLETLTVNSNKLRGNIHHSIGQLENLINLDLSKNRITTIPIELYNCKKLKRLNLEFNAIMELPESIGQLKELEYFGIKYNQLTTLPNSLHECDMMVDLNIENNALSRLPETIIFKLHKVKRLNLSHNMFNHMPKSLPGLISDVEKINIEYNHISRLNGALMDAKNLRFFNLSYNSLLELQSFDVHFLTLLVDLNLSFNHINELPKDIGRLVHLESLYVNNNLLKTTPKEIGNLKNLKIFNLETNLMTYLPDEFGRMEKLKHLNLSGNLFTTFPHCVTLLKNLEMLNFSENLLNELPSSIGDLNKLTNLILKDNTTLNKLPVSLSGMKVLSFLNLSGCPLKDIPQEYTKGPVTVIAYLRAYEISLKLHEFLKMPLKNKASSSDSIETSITANGKIEIQKESSSLTTEIVSTPQSQFAVEIRPRSMSACALSKKELIDKKVLNRQDEAAKFAMATAIVNRMKTTEAGFLAYSNVSVMKK